MAKFKVQTPVEHNQKLYWPVVDGFPPAPGSKSPSFGNGQAIDVDDSGAIELTEAEAAPLLNGRAIAPARKKAEEPKVEKSKSDK
jgi:hypothetical protein